jgi:hypothetical protein
MELDNLSSALTGEQPFTQTALRDVASFAGAPNPDRAGADLYTMAQFGLGAAGMMMASGSGASRGLAVGETNATTRVTQFYDPSRGGFGAGSADALTAPPTSWYKPLTRFGDGPVFGTATPRTWVSPFSAAEQNWWTRIMTGRPGYTNYVEFDVAASEMQSVGGLKGLAGLGRYQQFVPGPVSLSGRNPVFSQLGPNNGRWVFYGGLGLGLAGAGTATYWATRP